MTWKTVNGPRILMGDEAALFASCLACMIAEDQDGLGMNYNEPMVDGPFENLTPGEKYTVMEEVAEALLHESDVIPKRSAINESAIYYVFVWLQSLFETPDLEEAKIFGPMVIAAIDNDIWGEKYDGLGDDVDADEDFDSRYPSVDCKDLEKWDTAVECVYYKILWDLDFEMYENPMFDTKSAHHSHMLTSLMNTDPAYFKAYQGKEKAGAKDRLLALVRSIPGVNRQQI